MSTDLHDRKHQPAPDEGPEQKDRPKSALSITQVVAGALAAMTAAALGSRLSVAGTVVGAALASVVAAVASAIYSASLRRTTQRRERRPGQGPTRPGRHRRHGLLPRDAPTATGTAVADGSAEGWALPASPAASTPAHPLRVRSHPLAAASAGRRWSSRPC